MSVFEVVGDAAKAVGEVAEDTAGWIGDRAAGLGEWFGDLFEGNLGEQAVPQSELVEMIRAGKGSPDWHSGSDQAAELAEQHSQLSGRVQQLMSGIESSWTGGGADTAQARIRPLADVSEAAARTFTSNSRNVGGLAHGFDQLKASLRPMPETPPHRTFLDELQFWRTTDTEAKIKEYNEIAQQNLDKYTRYAENAKSAGRELKIDYGQLQDFGDGDVALTPQPKGPVEYRKGPDGPHPRSGGDHGGDQAPVAPPRSSRPPQPFIPVQSSPVRRHPPTGDVAGPPHRQPGGAPSEGTTTVGWAPLVDERPSGPGWAAPALSNVGGGADSGTSSQGFVADLGRTGGLPGNGSSSPGRSAGGWVGGPRAGSGAVEAPVARPGANAAATRGTAGAKGTPGVGGMAGGRGGKAEEDQEHRRKYGLDDDCAFTLVDDEDGRLRDPRTGLPPTPPTIGG